MTDNEKETCKYCDDTGMIGSPFELGSYPCTDCNIFWDRVRKVEVTHEQ